MRNWFFLITVAAAQAQWLNHPWPGIHRTRDGKPNLSAPAPRLNGKPDLSGLWQVVPTPLDELNRMFPGIHDLSVPGDDARSFHKYLASVLADFKPGEAPLRPEAAKVLEERIGNQGRENPTARCLAASVPFASLLPFPAKFVQTPGLILIVYEGDATVRQIYTDGRKLPADPQPSWMGYSVGRWEGDTLVVDSNGFNTAGWLDAGGTPRSESLRITERYRRRDFGHLDIQVTIDDPQIFTRPFSIQYSQYLLPDTDILETFCAENERDLTHMK